MRDRKRTPNRRVEILIVEDSPTQAEQLKYLLEGHGFAVTVASNAQKALAAAHVRAPALIMSDAVMPEMDGFELCKQVKAREDLKAIPFILVTSLSSPNDIMRGLSSGADNFIRKPYDEKYLLSRIDYILTNRELRKSEKMQLGVEIYFNGQRHFITSERQQILDLLISTYEQAVQLTGELEAKQKELEQFAGLLEQEVEERTAALTAEIAVRERAEQALRESEEHYRLLFENNPLLMWIYDTETLAFLAVNETAVHHYGYSHEEFLRMKITDIRPAEDVPALLDDVSKTRAAFDPGRVWRHSKKDGSLIFVEISSHALPFGNRNMRLVLVNDITERKKLEEQFRRAQKMEAIGQLAGGIAHDFNNLLSVINGYSQIVLERFGANQTLRGYVEEILRAGNGAASLTRQLLAFSRQQVLAPQVLDLNQVVASMEKMLRRLIGEDINLVAVQHPNLGHVKVDPGQIEQVLMNLAVNARDAMPRGGKLTIEATNADLDEAYSAKHLNAAPGSYVMLAVSDTGIGMNEQIKSRIFEPFFTTKEQGKGTGLGLATVYGIVKQSGGYIWVYSEPGRGSTFKIYFPRVDSALTQTSAAEPAAKVRGGSETILLVEDEAAVRGLMLEILHSRGYQVLVAESGQAALDIGQKHNGPIHLLLTDVVMPGMSGRELAERIVASRPETMVLYMSGYTDDAIVRHGVLGTNAAFLQKPYTPESAARKVRELLDNRGKDMQES